MLRLLLIGSLMCLGACGDDGGGPPPVDCPDDMPDCDGDGDGWPRCVPGDAPGTCDCDDSSSFVHPPGPESPSDCGDFVDQDCDGADRLCDLDADGFPADRPMGGRPDCDDTDPAVSPAATEVCTTAAGAGVDENCNGLVDELVECLGDDLDGDGSPACSAGMTGGCDCNDCDSGVHPAIATEQCANTVDEDCSGEPASCPATDADGDGDADVAAGGGDCNPDDPRIYTGAPERCFNGVSESCGVFEDAECTEMTDPDSDEWIEPPACEGDPTLTPMAAEGCNGADDDCDGRVDEMLSTAVGCAAGMVIDYGRDLFHCGGCRNSCNPAGARRADRCQDGVCDCAGEPGTAACEDTGAPTCCRDGCVDVTSDARHCGGCDLDCALLFPGRSSGCLGGTCRCGTMPLCPPGSICTSGACVGRT